MIINLAQKAFFTALENVEFGSILIKSPDGKEHKFVGKNAGPQADMTLHNWGVLKAFILHGDVGVAETYSTGDWDTNDIEAVMQFGLLNEAAMERVLYGSYFSRLFSRIAYMFRANSLNGSRQNIAAHYDLGNDFYSLWLDETMTYSSAIFSNDNLLLPQAQNRKYDRMLERLNCAGELLEIGCGWGGMAERAIEKYDHSVKGLTLSVEQQKYAQARLQKFNGNANIALQDYRHETKKFDNIVSIEMFEAVGEKYWDTYFGKVSECLKSKGKAIIQTITIDDKYFETYRKGADMIRTFIFPGGMLPSPSKFEFHANKADLQLTDKFAFGKDYAKTLRQWLINFEAKEQQLDAMGFDEKFRRLWKMYLAACAASFEVGRIDVMQLELQHA
jgi:cyclopropane-fatty-acyl-phospholipid synthase